MRSKTKVLQIITRLSVGGSSNHSILLAAHLDKKDFDVMLIKGKEAAEEGNLEDSLNQKRIIPVLVPELKREVSFRNDLVAFLKLYRLMSREKPDIVHTHSAKAGTLGRLAAKLAGVPIIIHTFHGHLFRGYFSSSKSKLIVFIERLLSLISTKIIAVTESQKEELWRYKIAPKQKIVSIPLGLELDAFMDVDGRKSKFKSELGLEPSDLLIGSIARLVPVKGHSYLFQAAKIVISELPNARFLIVGDGMLRKRLEGLAESLGIQDNVIFCGFQKDLPKIYADLDILVLTSLNEGLPVAVIEAMAAQTAVVAYDVGGVKDLVEPGVNGISLPFGEIDGLGESIIYLLKNARERERLGQNGRRKVYPYLHYKRMIRDVENLYTELLMNIHPGFERSGN
jgi:glycosyltransferase involved in cell wall biosynthesis